MRCKERVDAILNNGHQSLTCSALLSIFTKLCMLFIGIVKESFDFNTVNLSLVDSIVALEAYLGFMMTKPIRLCISTNYSVIWTRWQKGSK